MVVTGYQEESDEVPFLAHHFNEPCVFYPFCPFSRVSGRGVDTNIAQYAMFD